MSLDSTYWNNTYLNNQTGWDVGYVTTPLKEYFDQLEDKKIKILIPGAGNAYEVEYLYIEGFTNVFLLEFAEAPIKNFLRRCPDFPKDHIIQEDFFKHQSEYDLIIEHTFLTSFNKSYREDYAKQMHNLLKPNGKFVGLLFNHNFDFNHPPYGGTEEEYINLFSPYFNFQIFETAHNSIKPRKSNEIFFKFLKK